MKPVSELISGLRRKDVRLRVDGEKLLYNAPRGTMTPALRRQIAERKQEILKYLGEHTRTSASSPPFIRTALRKENAPLSFAQKRLWFLDRFEPNRAVYNLPIAMRMIGPLEITVLERSINEIVRRHHALETTFSSTDEEPIQVIHPDSRVDLHLVDLQETPLGKSEQKARRLISKKARLPFNLAKGPCFRTTLFSAYLAWDIQ